MARQPRRAAPDGAREQRRALRRPASQWLYGRHAVAAALANPARRIRRFLALGDGAEWAAGLLKERPAAPIPEIVDRHTLEGLLPAGAVHQGVAIEAEALDAVDLESLLRAIPETGAPHIFILLDQVTDPHNVGAILRSAAAFGVLGVIVPEHGAPQVSGALAKAASGALEAVPLLRVTNLVRCLEGLKEEGFWSVGLDATAPQSLASLDLPQRIALVLGAEGAGLRRLVRAHCDFLAHLPTRGALASLNVSNAAAVALFALTQPR